jgi:hypothetical protein
MHIHAARRCAACAALFTAACSGDAERPLLEVVRDTVADTVVVRTVAGSAWGVPATLEPEITIGVLEGEEEYMFGQVRALAVGPEGRIFALDVQIPAVRVYSPDGVYQRTLGRAGGGPGEFGRPDGLLMLSDGRLVVRDVGNARLQLFGPDLEPTDTWPVISGNFSTSTPPSLGRGDTILTPVVDTRDDIRNWRTGLQRVAPDGTIVDTLMVPHIGYEAPTLEARREDAGGSSVSVNSVPFSPGESWAWHPDGYFLHGVSDAYRFSLLRDRLPLRIERMTAPVPVTGGEKSSAEAETTRNMRGTDPNWRWNGPGIPDSKPYFSRLYTGADGRIWVQVPQRGIEVENLDHDPTEPGSTPTVWRQPVAFDVFESDGTFLGTVTAPEGFSPYPTPIFDGDLVWGVTRDDLGVQRVVRYRVERVGGD